MPPGVSLHIILLQTSVFSVLMSFLMPGAPILTDQVVQCQVEGLANLFDDDEALHVPQRLNVAVYTAGSVSKCK